MLNLCDTSNLNLGIGFILYDFKEMIDVVIGVDFFFFNQLNTLNRDFWKL